MNLPQEAVPFAGQPTVGIYFLKRNDKVVYVGRTTNLEQRLTEHRRNKEFDSIHVLPMDKEKLVAAEAYYIAQFEPPLNAQPERNPRRSVTVTFRLEPATLAKLEAIAERIAPLGSRPSLSMAVRYLIEEREV